jgi:hypothetical protein
MTTEDDTMSTGKPDHEITDVNRSYQADDADLTIISADGIHFKVHRVVLLLARYVRVDTAYAGRANRTRNSTVFKDMLAIPTKAKESSSVSLADNAIENGKSIKAFLDLLYGEPVPIPRNDSDIAVLKLVQKYECAAVRRLVLHAYADYLLRQQVSPILVFRAAAMFDSPSTCELAIRDKVRRIWAPAPDNTGLLKHGLANQPTFDLRGMQYDMIGTIPLKYSVALLRAHLVVDLESATKLTGRGMTQAERDRMADEFKRLMA